MAIKDQCMNCKHNTSIDSCAVKGINLVFDGISCKDYTRSGIDLSKHDTDNNTYNVSPTIPPNQSQTTKKRMFQHPFSFSGRIRRLEYCLTYLGYFLFCLPMNVMEEDEINPGFALIWLLLFIPVVWIMLAQRAKRCHDRDNSGWYQIIPFYGFWMLFADGDKMINDYGFPPK